MYPYFKLLRTLWKARRQAPLEIEQSSVIECRAGVSDIDVFGELNNGRHLVYFELGRWDYAQRVGFMPLMRQNRWGFVVGGASVRFRRRVRFMNRFNVTTQMLCHDKRWFYFLQEIHRNGEICSSALMKAGVTAKGGLVPAHEVVSAMGRAEWGDTIPNWVQAWIDAESQRPWPPSNS